MFTRKDTIPIIIKKSVLFIVIFVLMINLFEHGINFSEYTYEVISVLQIVLTLIFIYIFSILLDRKKKKKVKS